jgi:hypothetical protein
MKAITDQTTLAELDLERQRLGIVRMRVSLVTVSFGVFVDVVLDAEDGFVHMYGDDLPGTFTKAFEERERQIGVLVGGTP